MELSDHDRPLLDIGISKTQKIAEFLCLKKIFPDLIISSSAVRAIDTAKIIASKLGYRDDKIEIRKTLYHAIDDDIFDELFSIDNQANCVMIFGHNPGFTYFANHFVRPMIENLPTSGVVSIDFLTDSWESIPNSKFNVNFVITPKMLK